VYLIKQQNPEAFERDYLNLIARESTPSVAIPTVRPGAADHNDQVDEFTTVGRGGKVVQFTSESIFKDLQSVQEARGKKVIQP
jgi:translation initiation factor 3 subunit C